MDLASWGIGQYIGIALALWVVYDLLGGSVWLHRKVLRTDEPMLYWFGMLLWSAVAATCFFYWY